MVNRKGAAAAPASTMQWPITSNLGRGLVQSAAHFGVVKAMLEYIWNSFDNPDDDQARIEVRVEFLEWNSKKKRRIKISDNARGMSATDVRERFLELFGENAQRARGKQVRGYFGTGKTAFLSIADTLDVTTVRSGERTRIRIRREMIERAGGEPKVDVIEASVPTAEPNGTVVVIENIHTTTKFQPDHAREKRKIINDVGRKLTDNDVIFHGERLVYTEPRATQQWDFPGTNPLFGDVIFVVKESKTPLEDDEGGFSVFTGGARRETTYLGYENSATVRRLWGAVEAPLLDNPEDEVPVATNARDKLNPENARVAALHSFMRDCVRQVIEVVEAKRRDRMAEETRREVQVHAEDIQRIINEDFLELENELLAAEAPGGNGIAPGRTRSLAADAGDVPVQLPDAPIGAEPAIDGTLIVTPSGQTGDGLTGPVSGDAELASPKSGPAAIELSAGAGSGGEGGGGESNNLGGSAPQLRKNPAEAGATQDETAQPDTEPNGNGTPDEFGREEAPQGVAVAPRRESSRTPPPVRSSSVGLRPGSHVGSGGFRIEIAQYGHEIWRSYYFPEERLIQVNLDYPSVREAMLSDSVTGPFFKALEYEIAFSEYATALTRQVIRGERNADVATPEGAVKFVSETMNRLSRHTAPLYAAARAGKNVNGTSLPEEATTDR